MILEIYVREGRRTNNIRVLQTNTKLLKRSILRKTLMYATQILMTRHKTIMKKEILSTRIEEAK